MEKLPQEIIMEVLSRLPVKSVVRFRCVCKSWLSLISESQFVKTHLNLAITDASVGCQRILLHSPSPLQSLDYEEIVQNNGDCACSVLDFLKSALDDVPHDILVSGSCNGMVCITVVDSEKIILFNPTTRDIRELPKLSRINFSDRVYACGLGYDSSVDDYKVLIVVPASDNDEIKAEIFSLRSNSWKTISVTDSHPNFKKFEGFRGVFLNGALHWLAKRGRTGNLIFSFDLATEKFQQLLSLPPRQGIKNILSFISLIVIGNCLSVSIVFGQKDYFRTQVWAMKEYGVEASWTKLFTICDDSELGNDYYFMPVCFLKSGEIVVDVDGVQLRIYNPKDHTCRVIYTTNGAIWDWDEISVYVESLVSPNFILNQ